MPCVRLSRFEPSLGRLLACVCVLALVGTSAEDARAQSNGSLVGDVVDGDTGEPVAGIVVTAVSPALQGTVASTSDVAGRYRIDGLPIGPYTLTFVGAGYAGEPISGIQLRGSATLRYDAVVYAATSNLAAPGASADSAAAVDGDPGEGAVRVIATAPVIDIGSTQTGGVLTDDITRRVPLVAPSAKGGAQRSFESAATVMPQVQSDTFGASVNGATSVENQYIIDGVSVNNLGYGYLGSPLSVEFIKEIGIITGGYLPEYGRAMGGLLNVVTKSGSNELQGSVWGYMAPGFLEGARAVIPNTGSAINTQPKLNHSGDVGFELSGPILKDRLWFYTGAAINTQSVKLTRRLFRADGTEVAGAADTYFAEATGLQSIAKLTWAANVDNRVSLTVLATPTIAGGPGKFGFDLRTGSPEGGQLEGTYDALARITRAGAVDANLKWESFLLARKLRFDTSIAYHREQSNLGGLPWDGSAIGGTEGLAALPRVQYRRSVPGFYGIADFEQLPAGAGCDAPGVAAAELCPVTTYRTGGPGFLDTQTGESIQLRNVSTYTTDLLGLHVFKAGGEVGYGSFDNLRAYSGGRVYRDNASGTLFTDNRQYGFLTAPDEAVLLDSLRWRTGNLWAGAFLHDSWTVFDVVTLNLGLRYDGQWMFAGDNTSSMTLPMQLSPRAGVIVDPLKSGRLKIYGSYARYYESIPLGLADRAGTSEPQIVSIRPAAVCDPRDPKQNSEEACLNDDNRLAINDYDSANQKWIVSSSGRTAIDPALQPASSDEIILGVEAEIFRDARVAATYTRRWIGCPFEGAETVAGGSLCSKAIEDMSRDEANTYFIGNPGFGNARDFAIAERHYDALTLLFHKQWSEQWLGQASYTLSSLNGNYAGLFRPETEQLDPNINSDYDLRSLTINRMGPLPFDRTHQLKLYGAREFSAAYDTTFTLGVSASATSGGPTNYFGSHPVYGGDEIFILPRGSGDRLPWTYNADVRAAFTFRPVKGQAIELSVDVFNLVNFQDVVATDETYTEADVEPLLENDCKGACNAEDLSKVKTVEGETLPDDSFDPNFGKPIQFQAPRTVRFGVRWSF